MSIFTTRAAPGCSDHRHIQSEEENTVFIYFMLILLSLQSFLHGHDAPVTCLALSPNASLLASGQTGKNADLLIWDYAKRSIAFRLSEHDFGVACVAFSPDGKLLASVGNDRDRKMIVWDTSSGCIVSRSVTAPLLSWS